MEPVVNHRLRNNAPDVPSNTVSQTRALKKDLESIVRVLVVFISCVIEYDHNDFKDLEKMIDTGWLSDICETSNNKQQRAQLIVKIEKAKHLEKDKKAILNLMVDELNQIDNNLLANFNKFENNMFNNSTKPNLATFISILSSQRVKIFCKEISLYFKKYKQVKPLKHDVFLLLNYHISSVLADIDTLLEQKATHQLHTVFDEKLISCVIDLFLLNLYQQNGFKFQYIENLECLLKFTRTARNLVGLEIDREIIQSLQESFCIAQNQKPTKHLLSTAQNRKIQNLLNIVKNELNIGNETKDISSKSEKELSRYKFENLSLRTEQTELKEKLSRYRQEISELKKTYKTSAQNHLKTSLALQTAEEELQKLQKIIDVLNQNSINDQLKNLNQKYKV